MPPDAGSHTVCLQSLVPLCQTQPSMPWCCSSDVALGPISCSGSLLMERTLHYRAAWDRQCLAAPKQRITLQTHHFTDALEDGHSRAPRYHKGLPPFHFILSFHFKAQAGPPSLDTVTPSAFKPGHTASMPAQEAARAQHP